MSADTEPTRPPAAASRLDLSGLEDRPGVPKPDPIVKGDGIRRTFGGLAAVDVDHIEIQRGVITALIGPPGCGKSTLIRCLNRMNDLIPTASVDGTVLYHGQDLYGKQVDPVEVRKRIGMVFQKPNPFPKSIFDNIAFGPRVLGLKDDLHARVEGALRRAALWDEVKDRLDANAYGMSGGQQQMVAFGRALMAAQEAAIAAGGAPLPQVLIGDEPYYGKFGFSEAPRGWQCPGPWDPERLLVRAENPAVLPREGMLGPWRG